VLLSIMLCVCGLCVRISFGSEGNVLYPVLSSHCGSRCVEVVE